MFLLEKGKGVIILGWITLNLWSLRTTASFSVVRREFYGFIQHPGNEDTRLASPGRAPLRKVYFLRKGLKNELIPLSSADVVGRFLACSFPLSYSQESVNFIISFLERISSNLPCFELRFLSDTEIVDSILGEAERPH